MEEQKWASMAQTAAFGHPLGREPVQKRTSLKEYLINKALIMVITG